MAIPTKIGRYEIKSELGRGGMATVYRAFDPSFDREVALKVLPREMLHDTQFRARFEREIKMVAGLEHPAIVPVYDVGDEDGQPYFVMRLMTGGSLAGLIEKGKVPIEETARIVERIAQGLAYAHKKGIVHRDLKPDNILFDDNNDPFISDFGIAKLTQSSNSLTGSGVIGTPAYMSPEQAQGVDIDGRSDVYGLGVIVYQMLSGQQPYKADTPMGVVVKHITEPVPEILQMTPSLPIEVDDIIKSSMAKDRAKRFSTTLELAKALNLVALGHEGNISSTSNTGMHSAIKKTSAGQSSRSNTGLVVAGIILLAAVVGFFLLRNQLFASQTTSGPTIASTVASTVASVTTNLSLAPACAAGITVPAPVVEETNKACITKIPYTSVSMPERATFESQQPGFTCAIATTKDGKSVVACTGKPNYSFNLKVCTPPVVSNADLSKCSQDSIFNSANQCCVTKPPDGVGCTIFKVDLRSCE